MVQKASQRLSPKIEASRGDLREVWVWYGVVRGISAVLLNISH